MKSFFCVIVSIFLIIPVFPEVSFSAPDINPDNEVLFSVSARIPGSHSYETLFQKSLETGTVDQLTFFPEKMESLGNGSVVQVRNRFGMIRYSVPTGKIVRIEERKPFVSGGTISSGMLPEMTTSPDGRWLILIEPVTAARGKMILVDTSRDVRYILADSVGRGFVPVSWSRDSSLFVYEVSGTLYFARPESFFSTTVVDSKYRSLGEGTINTVSWYRDSHLMYISGTDVYRIQASELFSRSLYSPLLGYGELAGKIPFPYDPACDSFHVSPDGEAILYSRGNRSVYYCPLDGDDFVAVTKPSLLPWVLLSGNTVSVELFWTPGNTPVVLAFSMEDGKRIAKAWKMTDVSGSKVFVPVPVPDRTVNAHIARDGASIAFVTMESVLVYNTITWKETGAYRQQKPVSVVWGDGALLYIGGTETLDQWNFQTGAVSTLLLSAVKRYGWDEAGKTVLGETGTATIVEYTDRLQWVPTAVSRIRPATSSNKAWRLYTDSGKGYYTNMLYVRSTGTPGGTWPLVREPVPVTEDIPALSAETAAVSGVFSHGKRNGNREVSLVFDAMDSLEGLSVILDTLHRYGIRATFFINGEFIRRNPAAVNEIVKAGHQCASLFYTTWDLSGTQYRIDEDFIIRGLSRNEDDFFNATGQELSLFWHAPHYVLSPDILGAGEKSGYRYISPDVMVPDWVSAEQDLKTPGMYRSAYELVEDIVRKKMPGSIIPVRIGKPSGYRDSYLFEQVDLLVNALMEAGYRIVTVDTLIQNAAR